MSWRLVLPTCYQDKDGQSESRSVVDRRDHTRLHPRLKKTTFSTRTKPTVMVMKWRARGGVGGGGGGEKDGDSDSDICLSDDF